MELACTETKKNRSEAVLNKILYSNRRHVLPRARTFNVGQNFRFTKEDMAGEKEPIPKLTFLKCTRSPTQDNSQRKRTESTHSLARSSIHPKLATMDQKW